MNLSPINYQIGVTQNNSLKRNYSPNFKSEIALGKNVETRVVRNLRTYYKEVEKPLFKDLLEKFTKGFARKEESKYSGVNIETVYYDAENNIMATVYDVQSFSDEGLNHFTLSTSDKDYIDWGRTGVVDCYDEDQTVVITEEMRKRSINYLPPQKLINTKPSPFELRMHRTTNFPHKLSSANTESRPVPKPLTAGERANIQSQPVPKPLTFEKIANAIRRKAFSHKLPGAKTEPRPVPKPLTAEQIANAIRRKAFPHKLPGAKTEPRPVPKPLTAEQIERANARLEAEMLEREQAEIARKAEEAKKAKEARLNALRDGTWLNDCYRMDEYGCVLRAYPAGSNAIEMPVIANEKSLPKRIRNMINILREDGYAVEYQNGVLKGEYIAKDQPKFWDLTPNKDYYRNIILIDTKNNKILGCNKVIREKYMDRCSSTPPKVSLARKGQIKLIDEPPAYFSNPHVKTTYYDKDTGKYIISIDQAKYDNNPYRNLFGMGPAVQFNENAVKYHKIVSTKEPDGTFKNVLYYPGTLSVVEYTGRDKNRTMKITQWKSPTDKETEVLILNADDIDKLRSYQLSDRFHRVWDRGGRFDVPTYPNLDQGVPSIKGIKSALDEINQLIEKGYMKID